MGKVILTPFECGYFDNTSKYVVDKPDIERICGDCRLPAESCMHCGNRNK